MGYEPTRYGGTALYYSTQEAGEDGSVGQPGLQMEFLGSQDYIHRPYFKNVFKKDHKSKHKTPNYKSYRKKSFLG